ncbi:hypothetical protein DEU34_0654 [Microbacterium sp. AG1240]|uniref:hypothetical protein n=1 Tax=Microbacterium sp. AG1240 TaxID=2183992 RepID=UPI000EB1D5FE|nr:hypothetical protein [Microbacterium sp. AG1240]RKT36146.1 hypothetical protein DEU34_0654 [Microbacterium sp. AG1240]
MSKWEWTPDTTWAMVGALRAAAAVLVALVAAAFVIWQVRQTRLLAQEQARPYVSVWVEVDKETRSTIELHIKNTGHTAAKNIKVALTPAHEWARGTPGMSFMDARVFTRGLPTMPPGMDVTLAMEFTSDIADQDPVIYTAVVTYDDSLGARLSDTFELDPQYLAGALWLDTHGVHHLAKSVRGIAKKMGVQSF